MSRLLLVSNRLPVTIARREDGVQVQRSVGGLATGLAGVRASRATRWIGWPGSLARLEAAERAAALRAIAGEECVPVELTAEEVRHYYEGIANSVLWPLFHYLASRVPTYVRHWDTYRAVNERFADAVAAEWRPGDRVWVHDYQLLLVPAMVRRRLPEASIGFFLHIPFPAWELLRTLPMRRELVMGLLGADVIGFHTESYARHFREAAGALLRLPANGGTLEVEGRQVQVGAFPMGVDAERFAALGGDPAIRAEARRLRSGDEERLLLGVDRLDYTKGIPRRLLAFEEFLAAHPDFHERVRLVQIAVPSRTRVPAYRAFRRRVDALVGRINGRFGTPRWTPVHYLSRGFGEAELAALYRAADVMLVTPIRDGMNLVAKEFVATRADEDGVLLLSEYAGAATELQDAVLVNPYDVPGTAAALHRALTMRPAERTARMRALRDQVLRHTVARWADSFVAALDAVRHEAPGTAPTPPEALEELVQRLRAAASLVLLLDYDGTLVPFAPRPELAAPDEALLDLLGRLAARRRTAVHIVSGRTRETLEPWLGALPLSLHAEHGLWVRAAGAAGWQRRPLAVVPPYDRLLEILQRHAQRLPGALIERKSAGVAWHVRQADGESARRVTAQLREELERDPARGSFDLLDGDHVLEVRPAGVSKADVVRALVATRSGRLVALGDDRTDEDMFAALPAADVAIHVGPAPSRAAWRVADVAAAREVLHALLE